MFTNQMAMHLNIRGEMLKNWPDKKNDVVVRNSENFWVHEWNKHDTCSPWFRNPQLYFQKTLQLKQRFDV